MWDQPRLRALVIWLLWALMALAVLSSSDFELEDLQVSSSVNGAGLDEAREPYDASKPLSRIAYGSCANQSEPMTIWRRIIAYKPELWIWLGDNVYADKKQPMKFVGPNSNIGPLKAKPRFVASSKEEMAEYYKEQSSNPLYQQLRKHTHVVGTWDDHDFGMNDAGKEFVFKGFSQQLMLDFFGEPEDSPRRKQKGVYAAYDYGPPGKKVKVILLDTRYNRDPIHSDGDLLGEDQWAWLDKTLATSDAEVHIIGSSIQVIDHMSALVKPLFQLESWGHFPTAKKRLFDLINRSNVSGAIFISGDVHYGEIERTDCALSYPLYDMTSSGLTQGVLGQHAWPIRLVMHLCDLVIPHVHQVYGPYGYNNFATITIDWDKDPVLITLQIRYENGKPTHPPVTLRLSDLQPGANGLGPGQVRRDCTEYETVPWWQEYRVAAFFITLGLVALYWCLRLAFWLLRALFYLFLGRGSKHKKAD